MNDNGQKRMLTNLSKFIADIMDGKVEFIVVAARYNGHIETFQTGQLETYLADGCDAALIELAQAMMPKQIVFTTEIEPGGAVQ